MVIDSISESSKLNLICMSDFVEHGYIKFLKFKILFRNAFSVKLEFNHHDIKELKKGLAYLDSNKNAFVGIMSQGDFYYTFLSVGDELSLNGNILNVNLMFTSNRLSDAMEADNIRGYRKHLINLILE